MTAVGLFWKVWQKAYHASIPPTGFTPIDTFLEKVLIHFKETRRGNSEIRAGNDRKQNKEPPHSKSVLSGAWAKDSTLAFLALDLPKALPFSVINFLSFFSFLFTSASNGKREQCATHGLCKIPLQRPDFFLRYYERIQL